MAGEVPEAITTLPARTWLFPISNLESLTNLACPEIFVRIDPVHPVKDETHKAVPFPSNPFHHRFSVDSNRSR